MRGLSNPNKLAIDNLGTVYIIEDDGPGVIWAERVGNPNDAIASRVDLFASLSDCSAEPAGLYFDRNGQRARVHVQHLCGVLRNDGGPALGYAVSSGLGALEVAWWQRRSMGDEWLGAISFG